MSQSMDTTGMIVEDSPRREENVVEEAEDVKPDINNDEEPEDEKPEIENLDKSGDENCSSKSGRTLISVKLTSQEGMEFVFKVSSTIRMEKIMNSYCERVEMPLGDLRFHLNGQRIRKDDTPVALEMQDGDEITVNTERIGGWWLWDISAANSNISDL